MLSLTTLAATLAESNTYATARGKTAWLDGFADAKTQALRRGQDYIAGEYNARWITDVDNALQPDAVKYAIFEAAARELATPGILAPDITLGEKKILTGVKGITWEAMYKGGGAASFRPIITAVEMLLTGLVTGLSGEGATAFLDRA